MVKGKIIQISAEKKYPLEWEAIGIGETHFTCKWILLDSVLSIWLLEKFAVNMNIETSQVYDRKGRQYLSLYSKGDNFIVIFTLYRLYYKPEFCDIYSLYYSQIYKQWKHLKLKNNNNDRDYL